MAYSAIREAADKKWQTCISLAGSAEDACAQMSLAAPQMATLKRALQGDDELGPGQPDEHKVARVPGTVGGHVAMYDGAVNCQSLTKLGRICVSQLTVRHLSS